MFERFRKGGKRRAQRLRDEERLARSEQDRRRPVTRVHNDEDDLAMVGVPFAPGYNPLLDPLNPISPVYVGNENIYDDSPLPPPPAYEPPADSYEPEPAYEPPADTPSYEPTPEPTPTYDAPSYSDSGSSSYDSGSSSYDSGSSFDSGGGGGSDF